MHNFAKRDLLGRVSLLLAAAVVLGLLPAGLSAGEALSAGEKEEGFKPIFDGKTLKNWDGKEKFWSVEDGAITGETTKDNPAKGNTFLIWRDGKLKDFVLRLKFRIEGHNSGVQFRSRDRGNYVVGGYQADFDAGNSWTGSLYDEKGRGVLARRGTKVVIGEDGKKEVVGKTTPEKKILASVKKGEWNDYEITARGNHITMKLNGLTTVDLVDRQKEERELSGILALQLHAGPPMKVQFKDIRLKELKPAKKGAKVDIDVDGRRIGRVRVDTRDGAKVDVDVAGVKVRVAAGEGVKVNVGRAVHVQIGDPKTKTKRIVFIAGRRSHGYGAHEHKAGCLLLAEALNASDLPVAAEVVTGGWPKDPSVLEGADAIVVYADGGGGHPLNKHLAEVDALVEQGVGLACLHYAVEVPKGEPGNAFLNWIGGYFETHWSVNPHWTAEFDKLPEHPITRGVEPFTINDEWYYHMRFRENMQGVTPILTDLPPESSLKRPDGAHSNNPHVRKAVLENEQPQHVAWAAERPDGGRGFGFTGGHNHWGWGHPDFRKLVLNAIVWTAGLDVPAVGVESGPVTVKDLMANQDYDPPKNFNPKRIEAMLAQWRRDGQGTDDSQH